MNTIIHGHVLNVLKTLPDESIHCVVTSPPYWGLRDYGIEPQVWGGNPDCMHEWTIHHQAPRGGKNTPDNPANVGANKYLQTTTLRNGGIDSRFCQLCGAWLGSLGLEPTPELYVEHMVEVFREVRRVMRKDATLWLNLGDSYNAGRNGGWPGGKSGLQDWEGKLNTPGKSGTNAPSLKPKDLVGIPWRVAFALQADGWWLRSDIIWHKPNPMPESVTDRPTRSHEYLFLMSKNQKYYYNADAIKEPVAENTIRRGPVDFGGEKGRNYHPAKDDPNYRHGKEQWGRTFDYQKSCTKGRNRRSVWTIATQPTPEAHFATFPERLVEPCILAGCPEGGIVLDPFMGSGTVAIVAHRLRCNWMGIELSEQYIKEIAMPKIEAATKQRGLF